MNLFALNAQAVNGRFFYCVSDSENFLQPDIYLLSVDRSDVVSKKLYEFYAWEKDGTPYDCTWYATLRPLWISFEYTHRFRLETMGGASYFSCNPADSLPENIKKLAHDVKGY